MTDSGTRQYEGLSANASDLIKIVSWAEDDRTLLRDVYLAYPRAKRINETMVCKVLQRRLDEWRASQ